MARTQLRAIRPVLAREPPSTSPTRKTIAELSPWLTVAASCPGRPHCELPPPRAAEARATASWELHRTTGARARPWGECRAAVVRELNSKGKARGQVPVPGQLHFLAQDGHLRKIWAYPTSLPAPDQGAIFMGGRGHS